MRQFVYPLAVAVVAASVALFVVSFPATNEGRSCSAPRAS
jgi:hypothetical protein